LSEEGGSRKEPLSSLWPSGGLAGLVGWPLAKWAGNTFSGSIAFENSRLLEA
jgi:hypothetical protein